MNPLPTNPTPDPTRNTDTATATALQQLLDRAAITQVVNDWGLARDIGRWDQLRACFTPDATMHTTWCVGSASEFVDRSIEAAQRGARAQHFIGTGCIALQGARALAETRMILMMRGKLDGTEVDVTCYGRFYDRFVKHDGGWRIRARVPIYEKDRLDPLDPNARVLLDPAELAGYPDGYRHIAYMQRRMGVSITPGLPVPNSPALEQLYAEGTAWLQQAPPPAAEAANATTAA